MFEPEIRSTPPLRPRHDGWWRGAVIYQIYPRSFLDTDGDGIGDLAGITARLDHLAWLGVDAVWISPFMRSPMKDYGYDVADYRDVDPLFGTLADFDRLLARAHELGLKLLIDFVPSHTSDRHAWFEESRQDRTNPRADWYVWADPRPDGTPPNNWLAHFGGPAWTWEPRRRQYYLHNFLAEQPQLNCWNDAVRDALLDVARFWLDRGVDGFRLDAVDCALHDPDLRDNPPRPPGTALVGGPMATPFAMQVQLYNKARPELSERFLKPLWALTDSYPGRVLLGELGSDIGLQRAAEHTNGGGLDIAYTFDLLKPGVDVGRMRAILAGSDRAIGEGWMCWSFSNHDVVRAPTRFAVPGVPDDRLKRLLPVLLGCLRGTPCLYQGDELGLEEAELRFEELHDPFGITFWPAYKGRDGARTPMPWQAQAAHAGFSTATPWLPVPDAHRAAAVDGQARDPASILNHTRAFLHWRRTQRPLLEGGIEFLEMGDDVLAFVREDKDERRLCIFNLGAEEARIVWPGPVQPCCPLGAAPTEGGEQVLAAHDFLIVRPA